MGHVRYTVLSSEGVEVTLTESQLTTLYTLMLEHPKSFWHSQQCECCICLHPGGDKTKGYIINEDGDAELVTHKDVK